MIFRGSTSWIPSGMKLRSPEGLECWSPGVPESWNPEIFKLQTLELLISWSLNHGGREDGRSKIKDMSITESLNEEAENLEDARNGGDGMGRARRGDVKDNGSCAQALAHQPLCIYQRGMPAMVVTAREVAKPVLAPSVLF